MLLYMLLLATSSGLPPRGQQVGLALCSDEVRLAQCYPEPCGTSEALQGTTRGARVTTG